MEEIPKEEHTNGNSLQNLSSQFETFNEPHSSEDSYEKLPKLPDEACSNIVQDNSNSLDKRLVLLKEGVTPDLEGLPENLKTWIQGEKDNGTEVVTYDLDIDHKSYSLDQMLKLMLPSDVNTTLKIENIREIKIFDPKEDQLKHKDTIGKIILEKSPLSQTVLMITRKKDESDPLAKYFYEQKYELLSGEPKTEIEIIEGPCAYKVDLLKVFYESAFQEERERLLSIKDKDDIICDLFGDPFYSIRAAKTNKTDVVANCHNNPDLYQFYEESIKSNQVESLVELHNKDLYTFLHESLSKAYKKEEESEHINHIYCGKFLEDLSFLKIFVGLFSHINNNYYEEEENLPHLHFYVYIPSEEFKDSMMRVLANKINAIFNESFINKENKDLIDSGDFQTIFIVKDDSQTRKLLQCTLKLTKKVAYCPESLVEQVITITTQQPQNPKESTQNKSAKKGSTRKSKKEIIHKSPKPVDELEKESESNETHGDGLRRSTRKKTRSKQFDDYEYMPTGPNKESSK